MAEIVRKTFEITDLQDNITLSKSEYSEIGHSTTNEAHLNWKFLKSPYQPVDATLMIENGVLIGRSMRHRRPFYLGAEEPVLTGATIFDVLVKSNNRNALSILNLIKQGSDLSDVDLILHGSNEQSLPIYSKLLKYPVAFSLNARGLPLRVSSFLKKITGFGPPFLNIFMVPLHLLIFIFAKIFGLLTNINFFNSPISTEEMDRVHRDFRSVAGPHFQRDKKFVKWRYHSGPIFNARLVNIYKGVDILGYVALRNVHFEDVNLGLVIDVQLRRKLNFLERWAFTFGLIQRLMKGKPDAVVVLANFNNSMLQNWFGFPFFTIPEKHLPHSNPIFALTENEKIIASQRLASTYLTLADLDYF